MLRHRIFVFASCFFSLLLAPSAFIPQSDCLSAETVEIAHNCGISKVGVSPKRVVTFDLSILDSIDELGSEGLTFAVPKQGLPAYLARFKGDDVTDAGGIKDPNLERIFEFQPDVIFISGRQSDYYDKLSEIAPTICSGIDFQNFLPSFRSNMTMLGRLFGRHADAEARADAVIARAEAIAEKAVAGGRRGLFLMVNDGSVSVYGPGSRFGIVHDILRVTPADPGIVSSIHGQSVDFEYIAKINPDIIYVISRNVAIGRPNKSTVLENELVLNTTAGKNGRIVNLDSAVWYLSGSGLESLNIILDEIEETLE